MEPRIRKACEGKTKSQGGLNIEDIKLLIKEKYQKIDTERLSRRVLSIWIPISINQSKVEQKSNSLTFQNHKLVNFSMMGYLWF
jgi:hypothetical protein